jgi:hypothetical protein
MWTASGSGSPRRRPALSASKNFTTEKNDTQYVLLSKLWHAVLSKQFLNFSVKRSWEIRVFFLMDFLPASMRGET